MFEGTPQEIADRRAHIVTLAQEWVSTPFHDCSGIKGVGCDCIHLAKCVYVAAGLVPDFELPSYKPQWFLHRDEPLILNGLAERMRQVETGLPGDLEMYSFGRHAAHCAIVISDRAMVHAYKPVGFVTVGDRAEFANRLHSTWSFFP